MSVNIYVKYFSRAYLSGVSGGLKEMTILFFFLSHHTLLTCRSPCESFVGLLSRSIVECEDFSSLLKKMSLINGQLPSVEQQTFRMLMLLMELYKAHVDFCGSV